MAWLHMHYHSEVLRMPVPMEVLVPQPISGGSRGVGHPGPYPTLYLLHGSGDDQTAWLRRTSIERYVEGMPLAVVMPAGHLGCYTDMVHGRDYFRFLTDELPAICERMFPLSKEREDRFIAGLSTGGYGALKAGLLASEKFSAAASFSGTVDVLTTYDRLEQGKAADLFGSRHQVPGSRNDLFAAASACAASTTGAAAPLLYMWCGTEDALYEENVRFKNHVLELGLPLTFEEGPGDHQWKYWDASVERVLKWLPLRKHLTEKGGV